MGGWSIASKAAGNNFEMVKQKKETVKNAWFKTLFVAHAYFKYFLKEKEMKNQMKRFAVFAVILAVGLLFSGCGRSGGGGASLAPKTAMESEPVKSANEDRLSGDIPMSNLLTPEGKHTLGLIPEPAGAAPRVAMRD